VRARAPASSANLGPGFDTLAVALGLYVEVCVERAPRLSVSSTGEGAELPTDAGHLAARVACRVAGTDRLAITVRSDIPVGRGLGSSAALAVAAAAAAGSTDPLAIGAEIDGHPENAAASVVGGLVTATVVGDGVEVRRLALDPEVVFVLVVPDRHLSTAAARKALPEHVPHVDACFNLGRMGLLVAGLADHRLLVPAATEDRLHQTWRTALFGEAPALLAALVEGGALAACWSGAGPSLLGICTALAQPGVARAATAALAAAEVAGRVLPLAADRAGVVVGHR